VKQPAGLLRSDVKRPDGATLIFWAKGKSMAWDVTVPDTVPSPLSASLQPSRQQTTRLQSISDLDLKNTSFSQLPWR